MNAHVLSLLLICVSTTGCFIPEDATPSVGLDATVASKYVHRGMTNVDGPVFQPTMNVALPTVTDDSVALSVKGNMDLTNDNGEAWFPEGHAGRFSEIDIVATYSKQLNETFAVTGGLFNYNFPNGQEFGLDGTGPGEERGGTNEVFVVVTADVLETTPYFEWHYDFDEVRGAYYRAGITESFPINDQFSVDLDGSLGYASSAQSDWLYDLAKAGFADLRGEVIVNYQYDDRTTLSAGLHGSMIVDSEIDRWFVNVGNIDDDPIWVSFGVNWLF
jgi:hypothetical protein